METDVLTTDCKARLSKSGRLFSASLQAMQGLLPMFGNHFTKSEKQQTLIGFLV